MLNAYLLQKSGTPLDVKHHLRLVEEADRVCAIAGVPKDMLAVRATDVPEKELSFVTRFRKYSAQGHPGYITNNLQGVTARFRKFTALCLRNQVDARYRGMQSFLDNPYGGDLVFIPFAFTKENAIPKWEAGKFVDALISRQARKRVTVLGMATSPSFKEVAEAWGDPLAGFFRDGYTFLNE